ncbi:MAG: glycosyltransferase family 39 protein [Candidatus Pedobacter colombiensis]|uniref:Glycosyltransferase family 39 protein n=1 Tax=Candidatus Pedobacter colombiensis TaxID=3121371 RepID=A0AAJ6B5H0_9SPHI|nr:glycosyltransferase family 39 protein [Pedobacter sp.]WEK17779.1 MAG: glycosyltransferase family 39 protein [Pedobacter sp.]
MKSKIDSIWLLILLTTAVRIIIALTLDFGNDEVYYWTYARHLEWNYFDHPPIVAWLIRITTLNLSLHNELAARFGAILSSAICTFIIYKTGALIHNKRSGWYAALLYSASFYCSIIAGTFILPDSPQMVFWMLGLFMLIKIDKSTNASRPNLLWIYFGIVAGLCIMCKVHGVFLWLAVGLYAAIWKPVWWRNPWMYISGVISLLIISPIVIWNFQNHFITYAYHGSRVTPTTELNPIAFFREIFGEFFYNNPFVFLLGWGAVWSWHKSRLVVAKKDLALLICYSLPLIVTLFFLALFRTTLPHWSGPAYSVLILMIAIKLADYTDRKANRIVMSSLAFYLVIVIAGLIMINFYPGTIGPSDDPKTVAKGDVTLDLYGWRDAGKQFEQLYQNDIKDGKMLAHEPIIINKWFPAAHIDFYIAGITKQETYGIGPIFDLHQYYFYNQYLKEPVKGSDAYYITSSNMFSEQDIDFNKEYFEKIEDPVLLPIKRNGKICKNLMVYRLRGFKGNFVKH